MTAAFALQRDATAADVETELAPAPFQSEWDRFVRCHPQATGYHLWSWRLVFSRALGHRCHSVVARRGSAITGILPLVEIRSRIFGRALSSLPYVNYGGVLAIDDSSRSALVERATDLARERGLSYVLLRHRSRLLPALPARDHKVTMLLALKGSGDAMWNALDRKVRNQIRKAEKSNLTVTAGGIELLDDFYGVFARNMRDLGTPVYGRSLFAAILSHFPMDARLYVVRLEGKPIAGALSYGFRDWIEVPSASSLREHRALCPSHLMYWTIIQQAISDGRRVFDFGRSTPNDGTFSFKEQWGALPEQLFWEYSLLPGATLPADDRHSSKFRASIEAWKRLPVGIATLLGPRIARSVP
jgi:FemAB-related protein (PEP-CTERM system-associated)